MSARQNVGRFGFGQLFRLMQLRLSRRVAVGKPPQRAGDEPTGFTMQALEHRLCLSGASPSPALLDTPATLPTNELSFFRAPTVLGDNVLFLQGNRDTPGGDRVALYHIYNARTGKFSTFPLPFENFYSDIQTAVAGKAIFKVSAIKPTDAVKIYDDSSGQWSAARLSQPRNDAAALTVGPLAIFPGGNTRSYYR